MSETDHSETKRCPGCELERPRIAFGADRRRPSGLKSRCRQCEARDQQTFRRRHPERARASRARWYSKHRSKEQERSRKRSTERYAWHREDILKRQRDRYNPEHRQLVVAVFDQRHPGRRKVLAKHGSDRRRARLLKADIRGSIDYSYIQSRDKMICHICRKKVCPTELNFDHVIPLAKGGEHSTLNLAVSHARCNQKKNARRLTLF